MSRQILNEDNTDAQSSTTSRSKLRHLEKRRSSHKIQYGKRNNWYYRLKHNLTDPIRLIESLYKKEPNKDTACMLCVKDEQNTVAKAIESTYSLVNHYIVVDENGETIPFVKKTLEKYHISSEYHIKPDLGLRESRRYALKQLKNTWLLIIDGDEYLTEAGRYAVTLHRNHPHVYLRTCKNILLENGKTPLVNNGFHTFLLHNNGTIKIPKHGDIPVMNGRAIHLSFPAIFNDHQYKPRFNENSQKIVPYDPQIQGIIPERLMW